MQLVKTYSQRSNGWYILVTITLDSKYIREREREIEDEGEWFSVLCRIEAIEPLCIHHYIYTY